MGLVCNTLAIKSLFTNQLECKATNIARKHEILIGFTMLHLYELQYERFPTRGIVGVAANAIDLPGRKKQPKNRH